MPFASYGMPIFASCRKDRTLVGITINSNNDNGAAEDNTHRDWTTYLASTPDLCTTLFFQQSDRLLSKHWQ